MADSDIQVTALTASQAGPGAILVTPVTSGGSCLPYLALAAVEIWGGPTSSTGSFTLLGDTITGFVHSGLAASTTRYYRARARDASGNYGDWYPSSGSVSATTSTVTPGPNSIGTDELKDDAVTGPKVKDGAVTQTKIGNAAIVNAHLGNAIIATANIQNAAITSVKIGAAQINNAHISSLSAEKITAGTLMSGIVYSGTVNADQVNAGTFTGLTFQTAPTGNRVVISAATNDLRVDNAVGFARIGGSGTTVIYGIATDDIVASFHAVTTAPERPVLNVSNLGGGGLAALFTSTGSGSTSHAARAATNMTTGGSIALGVSTGGGGWAAFAERGGYGPFTGGHDAFIRKDEPTEVGDIVCDFVVIARNGVDDTVTEVYVAEDDADPCAVGVVSRRIAFAPDSLLGALPQKEGVTPLREILAERYDRLAINSVGEGQVNVCGRGGDIQTGDLIMTSTLRGKGQRQPDGIVRNYTVAKAREDVTFASPDDVKRAACIYLCG